MGPVSDRTQAIKRGGVLADRVAIGSAADGGLLEVDADFTAERLGHLPQLTVSRHRLEWGVAEAARDVDGRFGIHRGEAANRGLQTLHVSPRRHSDVDLRPHFRGHDVGTQSPVNRADIHADAVRGIVQRKEPLDLVRELQHGARALSWIEARMGRATANDDLEFSDALARGLQLAA